MCRSLFPARLVIILSAFALVSMSCKSPTTDYALRDLDAGNAGNVEATLGSLGVTFDQVGQVQVDVENTTAFWRKIEAVKGAQRTIDLAYFLFADDYAGSYLGKLLVEKATGTNPVKVRLMVDAKTASEHHKFFRMLVAKGRGNIEVHYFRPMPKVVAEDFQRLGLNPETFVGALLGMNAAALSAQLQQSNVIRSSPALQRNMQDLVQALTQRAAADAATVESGAPDSDGASAVDAIVALQVFKVVRSMRESAASLGLKATGRDWFDLTKWTHHKLLLVDGEDLVAGGRNLEDAYHWEKDHAIRVGENIKKYVFMDVDFHLSNAAVAAKALTTFEGYLDPDCYVEPPVPTSCESQIPMARESASEPQDADAAYEVMVAKAAKLEEQRNYARTYEPVHQGTFSIQNARVAYAENRMFPADQATGKLLTEEPSQHNAAIVALINDTPAGRDVILQNAYVYLPSGLQLALIRALKRGVNVTVISNSPESSDLGFVAQAARLQYKHFLELGARGPGKFTVYEYLTEESLHAKVTIIGDRYLAIGSINADPRCEYLDTNNGVIIDSAQLTGQYKQWLMALKDKLMTERTRTITAADGSTRTTPLMRQVDLARIAQEDAQPTTDKMLLYHRKMKPLAAASFQDNALGAKARATLQSFFLQY